MIKKIIQDLALILAAPSNRLISYHEFKVGQNYRFEHSKTMLCINVSNGNFVAIVAHPVEWGVIAVKDYHVSYIEVATFKGILDIFKMIKRLINTYEPDNIYIGRGGGLTSPSLVSSLRDDFHNLTIIDWHYTAKSGGYTTNRARCLYLMANTIRNRLMFVTDGQALPIFKDMAMLAIYLKVTVNQAGKLNISNCTAKSPKEDVANLVFETLAMTHYHHED